MSRTYRNIQKIELMENGNFCLFAANGKQKRLTSICLLQTETENGSLFPASKRYTVLTIAVSANVPIYVNSLLNQPAFPCLLTCLFHSLIHLAPLVFPINPIYCPWWSYSTTQLLSAVLPDAVGLGYPSSLSHTNNFKGLSSEIYSAESGINRQVTLKGRGAEVFRRICPSPLTWEAL